MRARFIGFGAVEIDGQRYERDVVVEGGPRRPSPQAGLAAAPRPVRPHAAEPPRADPVGLPPAHRRDRCRRRAPDRGRRPGRGGAPWRRARGGPDPRGVPPAVDRRSGRHGRDPPPDLLVPTRRFGYFARPADLLHWADTTGAIGTGDPEGEIHGQARVQHRPHPGRDHGRPGTPEAGPAPDRPAPEGARPAVRPGRPAGPAADAGPGAGGEGRAPAADPPPPGAPEHHAYCLRDRRIVAILDPEAVVLGNGRPAIGGRCEACGARVVTMVPRSAAS